MPFANSNGIRLYYEDHGTGVPVIFSHGLGGNHVGWWNQVVALRERYRVITYDLRSFGRSTDDDTEKPDIADDLAGLIDHLDVDRVVLFGQSLGGFAAGGFASRHPERVAALGLSSSAGGFVPIKAPPPDPEVIRTALASYENLVAYTLRQDSFHERDPRMFFLYEQIAGLNHDVQPLRALGMGGLRNAVEPLLAGNVPLLVLAGDEDPPHVRQAIGQLREMAPAAEHHLIRESGHLTFFEQPETFNRHLLAFLDRHVG